MKSCGGIYLQSDSALGEKDKILGYLFLFIYWLGCCKSIITCFLSKFFLMFFFKLKGSSTP